MRTAVRALSGAVATVEPVDLTTVAGEAAMLARVDRKYVVAAPVLEDLLDALHRDVRVLEIDHVRLLRYASTYFDTPDLDTYHAHRQQRRRRYKVRVRSYLDTDAHFLEVKYKGPHDLTRKERRPLGPGAGHDRLDEAGLAFAGGVVASAYALALPGPLVPSVTLGTTRSTFLSVADRSRMTVDVDVTFEDDRSAGRLRERYAVVETKSAGAATPADRVLRRLNVRPAQVSKYCAAIAMLRPDVPSNRWHRIMRTHFETGTGVRSRGAVPVHPSFVDIAG